MSKSQSSSFYRRDLVQRHQKFMMESGKVEKSSSASFSFLILPFPFPVHHDAPASRGQRLPCFVCPAMPAFSGAESRIDYKNASAHLLNVAYHSQIKFHQVLQ